MVTPEHRRTAVTSAMTTAEVSERLLYRRLEFLVILFFHGGGEWPYGSSSTSFVLHRPTHVGNSRPERLRLGNQVESRQALTSVADSTK